MKARGSARNALAALILVLAFASATRAQISSAYVAESGSDTGACTQSSPCRTIGYALGYIYRGEVIIQDSGVYPHFTVTRPATISAAPGVRPTIHTDYSQPAIRVRNGVQVVLRGLRLVSFTFAGSYGIDNGLPDGSDSSAGLMLHVEDCVFESLDQNISIQSGSNNRLVVKNSTFRNSGTGIRFERNGSCVVDRCSFEGTSAGILAAARRGGKDMVIATVRDSVAAHAGVGFAAIGEPGSYVQLTVENCLVTGGTAGINVRDAIARVSNSTITNNNYGFFGWGDATVYSRGNNTVDGNRLADTIGIRIITIPGT